MLALFISSFLSFVMFITYGTFISKIANLRSNFFENVLIGLVAVNTFASILSLFFPINIYILIALLLSCVILFYFTQTEIKSIFLLIKNKKNIILYSFPFILVAFIISIDVPHIYDTALYHLQSIKWIEEYPVVPGLANLHGRFGFNPNIFTLFALTSLFDIFGQEVFSINFTLFSLFVLYFINKLYLFFKREGITNLFIFILIVFIIILGLTNTLSSPSPDFISIAFPLFILTNLIKPTNQKEKNDIVSYIPALILCTYVITVKLATLPILILVMFIVVKQRMEIKKIMFTLPILSLIILPWLVRNIILTGWLIYPFSSIDLFNFDWKVLLSSVISMRLAVTGWARSPGEQYMVAAHMNLFEWFPAWWRHRLIRTDKLLFLASVFFPIVAFIGHFIKKIKIDFHTFTIISTAFIGVLFWLLLTPDIRFGKAFIITAAISPLLYLKFKIYWVPYYKPAIVFIFTIFLYFVGFNITRIAHENLNQLVLPKIIEIPVTLNFKTLNISGVNVYVPIEGDRCYNYFIPCTPYPDTTLILRGNTLKSGFKHRHTQSK